MRSARSATALVAVLLIGALLPSCGPDCPDSSSEAQAQSYLAGLDAEMVVAAGRVIRYVPADEVRFRGYDLDLRRSFHGRADGASFLRVEAPIYGILDLSAVMVVARQGEPPAALEVAGCTPLLPITEQEPEALEAGA